MKTPSFLALLLLIGISLAGIAFAEPSAPLEVVIHSSGARQLPTTSNGTVYAQGGNVTQVNINALSITKTWQGYYGNVTGNIHLDDANNNSFYVWGNGTSLSGQIYAVRNSSPTWSTVNCSTATQRNNEEAFLGVSPTDGDSVTNTFNSTTHPSFNIGLNTIQSNTCFSTNINVNNTAQSSAFYQMLLADDGNNTIYSTIIEDDEYGFNSLKTDFQLIVGENEHGGNIGPTTYYFFVELN